MALQQTCCHHLLCHPDQVYQLVTSTAGDYVSAGDEHRKGRWQKGWDLMKHFPLEHESTGPFQVVSVKIILKERVKRISGNIIAI